MRGLLYNCPGIFDAVVEVCRHRQSFWLCSFFAGASYAEERIPVVGAEASLKWADTNPLGVSAHFIVLVYGGEELLHSQTVEADCEDEGAFQQDGAG